MWIWNQVNRVDNSFSRKTILKVTQQQQVEDEDIIFNTRRFSSTLLPAAAPPKRRYKSEEFLHIFTTVEFHQRTREQVMGPSFLGLDGKQMKTRTFFTNTNCDTSGNLVYNNWIFNSGEKTKIQSAKFFSRKRKKIQENLTVEKPCKGWSLQIISERNHNLRKTREKKRKIGKTTSGNFFFLFSHLFFLETCDVKKYMCNVHQLLFTLRKIEENQRNLENVFINDI